MKLSPTKHEKNLYGNCIMLSPDGFVMCRCNEKKAIWYISRGLAKFLFHDPLVFQLIFTPKSTGNHGDTKYNQFYLSSKQNICCVCGKKKDLTKHHCVPRFYRKHLPDNIKNHNSHDVLLLCSECHHKYERVADAFRNELAKETGIVIHKKKKKDPQDNRISGLCSSLIRHEDKIPADKRLVMIDKISKYLGREVTQDDISKLAIPRKISNQSSDTSNHGKLVVEKFDHVEFVKRWRRHFIESMKPKYMPTYWDIDNPIENCSEV